MIVKKVEIEAKIAELEADIDRMVAQDASVYKQIIEAKRKEINRLLEMICPF